MTSPKLCVSGGTGRIGGATLRALAVLGVPATALIRSESRRHGLPDPGVDTLVADFADSDGLARALDGCNRLLLCSAHGPDMAAGQLAAVDAAERAGVERVIKISASPATVFPGTPAEAAAAHLQVEQALRASRMDSVAVRPNAFAQTLLGFLPAVRAGVLSLPLGGARVSWVDAEDVGRVAAALLVAEDLPAEVVEVTGPAGLTMSEVCSIFAGIVGHPVEYRPLDDASALEVFIARGLDPSYAEHVVQVFSLFRERDAGCVTTAVPDLTGAPATPVEAVLQRLIQTPNMHRPPARNVAGASA
jgi:uncharacterized protein YbjT (DUF2867 family)